MDAIEVIDDYINKLKNALDKLSREEVSTFYKYLKL